MRLRRGRYPLAVVAVTLFALFGATGARADTKAEKTAYEKLYDYVYENEYEKAFNEAVDFIGKYPKSKWTPAAEYWKCYSRQRMGHNDREAIDCYESFLNRYGDSKWADDARLERLQVARRLAESGDPYGKAVLEHMGERGGEGEFEMAVIMALFESGNGDKALKKLEEYYDKSTSREARRFIVYNLSQFDDDDVLPFLTRIARSDPDPENRRQAVYMLTSIADEDDEEVIGTLLEIMKTEKDPEVRRHVLYAIAEVDDPRVLPILINVAVDGRDNDMCLHATYALGEIDEPEATEALERVLRETNSFEVKKAALYGLIERESTDIIPVLKDIALSEDRGRHMTELRRAAVWALAEMGDEPGVIETLAEVFQTSDDIEVKKAALYAMADHGGKAAYNGLKEAAMNKDDEELARAATLALGDMLDSNDIDVVLEIYKATPFDEVRRAAMYMIMDIGGKKAVGALGQVLKTERDPDIRESVVWVLADVAAHDRSLRVRRAAVQALGDIGSPKARKALEDLLEKGN